MRSVRRCYSILNSSHDIALYLHIAVLYTAQYCPDADWSRFFDWLRLYVLYMMRMTLTLTLNDAHDILYVLYMMRMT